MGLLMSVALRYVVDRPVQTFLRAIGRIEDGDPGATVRVTTADEFGLLASHFNAMVGRIRRFNDELQARVTEATGEIDRRYREVRELNSLLFDLQRRLTHAERLAVSGRIMAEVAHEVGTPLHSVAGHLELLRRDLPPGLLAPALLRRLDIVETQVVRVIEIIARLLDLTRRPAAEPRAVDVNRLARDMGEVVRPGVVAAGLELAVEPAPGLPPVAGDPDQLQQAVLNLLTNAIDATLPGGRIRVATRGWPDQGEVELSVADTGRGIAAPDRERVFEPFFSTKPPGHGTGLGLFITAQIVRDHKGRVEVESEPGRGSVIRVFLPAQGSAA
jgi:two-component system NtrC family sensor kinase